MLIQDQTSLTPGCRYRVVGWRIKHNGKNKPWSYDIDFRRVDSELPISEVLRRPTSEELDDYKEYKRIRQSIRLTRNAFGRAKPLVDAEQGKNREPATSTMVLQPTVEDYFTLPIATSTNNKTNSLSPPMTPPTEGGRSPLLSKIAFRLPLPSPRITGPPSPRIM